MMIANPEGINPGQDEMKATEEGFVPVEQLVDEVQAVLDILKSNSEILIGLMGEDQFEVLIGTIEEGAFEDFEDTFGSVNGFLMMAGVDNSYEVLVEIGLIEDDYLADPDVPFVEGTEPVSAIEVDED